MATSGVRIRVGRTMKKILSIIAFLLLSGTAHAQVVLTNLGVPWPQSATQLFAPVGNCTTAPAYSLNGDPNTGMSSIAADTLCFATGGVSNMTLNSAGTLTVVNGFATNSTGGFLIIGSRSQITSAADNTLLLRNNAGTDFSLLQLGGTTSAFPAIQRSTAGIYCRLADDSAYCPFGMSQVRMGTTILVSATAPTISSGFGTSPSVPNNNGTAAFTVNVGTGGAASAGVITMPAANTGWNCTVFDLTAQAANAADRETRQTASTTTTVTVQNQTLSTGAALAWTASDILRLSCFAY